jgi:chlorite dismutase
MTAYLSSEEYQIYDAHKIALKEQWELVDEEKKALQIRLNTSIQVWKRAMHEWASFSDKKNETAISKLIALVELNGVESERDIILAHLREVLNPLFQLMETGKVSLKNAAERSCFSSSKEHRDELNEALKRYSQEKKKYEEDERAFSQERAPAMLLAMQEQIEKLQEERNDVETKISKKLSKKVNKEEIDESRSELLEKMNACVNYSAESQVPLVIPDLMGDDS